MAIKLTDLNISNDNDEALSVWLDLFRWVSAVLVVFGHIDHRMMVKIGQALPHERSFIFYALTAFSSFSGAAVTIFFVLSGYLVGGSTLTKFRSGIPFSWCEYLMARFLRLWIVLLPAMLASHVLNTIASHISVSALVFSSADADLARSVFSAGDMNTFLCNAAFLQTAFCEQYGGNGALWSLFNEFWYYISWPFVMIVIFGNYSHIKRLILASIPISILSFLAFHQFVGRNIIVYFSIWISGAVFSNINFIKLKVTLPIAVSIFIISLAAWRFWWPDTAKGYNTISEFRVDIILCLAFCILLMAMKNMKNIKPPLFKGMHAHMAGFSFSLYCVHTPMINFMAVEILSLTHMKYGFKMHPAGYIPYFLFFATFFICVSYAFVFSLFTERHTLSIRKHINALLQRRSKASTILEA